MGIITTLLLSLSLAMDAFAVSLGVGTSKYGAQPRAKFRLAFHFGLFQALMPILGFLAGSRLDVLINQFDHWLVLVLLSYVGTSMIRSGLKKGEECYSCDPSRGKTLLLLCVATSIDALAVGLSLAFLKTQIVYPALTIGVVTAALSTVGLFIGNRLGARFGKRMEIVGGIILNGIGLRFLVAHLFLI